MPWPPSVGYLAAPFRRPARAERSGVEPEGSRLGPEHAAPVRLAETAALDEVVAGDDKCSVVAPLAGAQLTVASLLSLDDENRLDPFAAFRHRPVHSSLGTEPGVVGTDPRDRVQSAVICRWSERAVTSIRRGFAFSATGMTTVSTPAS